MIVDNDFIPTAATADYLYKANYTREKIWEVVQKFRINFKGQEFANLQEKFKEVMKKEFPTNQPDKEDDNVIDFMKEVKSHKSPNSDKLMKAAKVFNIGDGMKLKMANMIQSRYDTPFAECKRIVGLVV